MELLYRLPTVVVTRWASAENPAGAPGEGGKILNDRCPTLLCGLAPSMRWDGCAKPAVEAPLGDFFGHPLERMATFSNAWLMGVAE